MRDSYGRIIDYLRVSVTDKCNLGCRYCKPNPTVKLAHGDLLSVEEMTLAVKAFMELGVKKVRITGGEPLLRNGVVSLVKNIAETGTETVMTTNATIFARFASDLAKVGLRRVNASLDTLDDDLYRKLTGGRLLDALHGIDAIQQYNFPLKINAVLQRGVNEDILPLVLFAEERGAKLRFIELMPFRSTAESFRQQFIPATEIVKRYGMERVEQTKQKSTNVAERSEVVTGNVDEYRFDSHSVGFITPLSGRFCADCDRMRLDALGIVRTCLHSEDRYDIRPYLSDFERLKNVIADSISKKPLRHCLELGQYQSTDMGSIGG